MSSHRAVHHLDDAREAALEAVACQLVHAEAVYHHTGDETLLVRANGALAQYDEQFPGWRDAPDRLGEAMASVIGRALANNLGAVEQIEAEWGKSARRAVDDADSPEGE